MSIVESLRKLVDPASARQREQERRVVREQPKRDDSAAPPQFECRVCGHMSEDGSFCSVCLADTMRKVRAGGR